MQILKLFFIVFMSMTVLFGATENSPVISISPTEKSVELGTTSVYLIISVSECPNKKPITVEYSYDANSTLIGSVTFANGTCTPDKTVAVDIPSTLGVGDSIAVSISATSDQTFAIDTNSTSTITISPPPSNKPDISISPVTKNIGIGTTSVEMYIVANKCPNREDINVTYVNEVNASNTGLVTFSADDSTGSICTLSQAITIDVPSDLNISDSFNVNISAVTSGEQELGDVLPNTATITILATVSDLNVTKTAINTAGVISTIAVNGVFQYIIDVENSSLYSDATGITVQDELPAGLSVDQTQTNADSTGWTCVQTAPILTCTLDGNASIAPGIVKTIIVTATAPSTAGSITNTVTVYSDNDTDILNNDASVTTTVVDSSSATDVCYTNSTSVWDHPNTCSDLTGMSYYTVDPSYTCTASLVVRNANLTEALSSVVVTKLYNPNIDNGICEPSSTCERKSNLNITDYSGYGGGYEYDLGLFTPDTNISISDTGTYYSGSTIGDIILYATYEKGGVTYAGKVSSCAGGASPLNISENAAQVDVVDSYSTASGSYVSWIGTKVSGKDNYVMNAVYLGAYGTTPVPQDYTADPANQYSSITVLYKLVDMDALAAGETCESATGVSLMTTPGGSEPVVSIINVGDTAVASQPFIMAYTPDGSTPEARKNLRFQYKTVDFNELINDAGINCVQRSSTGGVVEGIPACMIANANDNNDQINTAIENYIAVFGQDAYESCYTANGQPCYASNGGIGAYPYDTEYGCFECSIGAFPATCSSDNFAIRPEKFDINSTDISYPDLMRAGQDYDLNVNAVHYGTSSSLVGYNQVSTNLYVADPTKYWGEGGEANASMFGIGTWGSDFNITDGYTTINGIATPVPYAYDDVGDISIHIEDYTWSAVDINNLNDPTSHDCSVDGAYVCGDKNATFIPHHFAVTIDDLHNNSMGDTFTYLSNDLNMSARFGVTIIAQTEQNSTTKNFTQPAFGHTFYENPLTVLIDVPNSSQLGAAVTDDINVSELLEFNAGVKSIPWNEDNETLRLAFNYPRTTNTPINPFIVGGLSKVDVNSTYTGSATEGTAYIDGTDNADDNVTFVYGRTHMARTRTMCGIGSTCTGYPIFYYEFYGDKDANQTLITQLLTTPQRSVDSVNWYKNTLHTPASDGNVTSSAPISNVSAAYATDPSDGSRTKGTFIYDTNKGYPYKVTVDVTEPGQTKSWLIYDKYKAGATQVSGQLEYYGPGKWSGSGGADTSVNDDTSTSGNLRKNTNRRIRW